jgi:hypothetical protein
MTHADPNYIYIVGRGRSGSTLLELMLGGHSDITAMGELEKLSLQYARDDKAKYPGLCSCGVRPTECEFWSKIATSINQNFNVDLGTSPFGFRVSDVGWEEDYGVRAPIDWSTRMYYRFLREISYNFHSVNAVKKLLSKKGKFWAENRFFVAREVAGITGAKYVVDASKDRLGMRDVYDNGKGRVKVLFLTRDVFGNVWSSTNRGEGDIGRTAQKWVDDQARILKLLQDVDSADYLHVKYEDICINPENECKRICNFLKIEYQESMLKFRKEGRHTIGGNKIRYKEIDGIKQDFSWKGKIGQEDIDKINDVSLDMQKKLNYI